MTNAILLTRDELKAKEDAAFQRGVERGKFEAASELQSARATIDGLRSERDAAVAALPADGLDALTLAIERGQFKLRAEAAEASLTTARADSIEVERLREALEWYAAQVAGCRKITREGETARHALDADGGKRARAALSPPANEPAKDETEVAHRG